jgi:scavenger receptor class B protein 1
MLSTGKAIDSILKQPDSLFIRVKIKDILFNGLIIDCNVQDFPSSAVCGQLETHYEKLQMKLVGKNLYASSIMGQVNYANDILLCSLDLQAKL